MILARREFLKLLGLCAGTAGLGGCGREWLVPDRLVELALRGPGLESHAQTVCGLCEAGCGLTVRLVDGLPVGLKGNPHHPMNRGGLCPVGQAGLDVLYAPERLQGPLRREPDGRLQPTTWDDALEDIGRRLAHLRSTGAGQKLAILNGNAGALFDELVRRFAHVLGSPNVTRLQSPETLPYMLSQGIDEVPGFDLRNADLVLSFGLDLYEDGPAPVQAISAIVGSRSDEERGEMIHIGTRLSPTAAKAEEHLPVRPGTHGALALGVAHVLVREGNYDRRFVEEHTFAFDDWTDEDGRKRLGFRRLLLERYYPDRAAQLCGCDPTRIIDLARRFAAASTPLAVVGGEALSASNATWNALAVNALNALAGAFDRPGGVVLPAPVPLTPLEPLPAVETGASLFAAPPGAFHADPIEALCKGVLDETHPLEALVIIEANPVHSSPLGEQFRQAVDKIPLVIALAPFADETTSSADYILPTDIFLESWSEATTPATIPFSVLGISHPVVQPLFDTRSSGDILLAVARHGGADIADAIPWRSYTDYLKHRLNGLVVSGQGSVISGSFEESWVQFLEERGWRFLEHGDIEGFWNDIVREGGWWDPVRTRGDWARLFETESGRYEFFSRALEHHLRELGSTAVSSESEEDPRRLGAAALGLQAEGDEVFLPHFEPPTTTGTGDLTLIPFRPLTARGPRAVASPMILEMFGYAALSGWQTWVELAPSTAHDLDLADGDIVVVESDRDAAQAVVRVHPGAVPGVVHMPIGLGHTEGTAADVGSNPLAIVQPASDPLAGTPSLTSTRVRLRLARRRPHGAPAPSDGGHV